MPDVPVGDAGLAGATEVFATVRPRLFGIAYRLLGSWTEAEDVAQSARSRRETSVGPWLPEPVDTSADPTPGAERDQAVDLAVLLLLEKLTPTERAAFVLREPFGYPTPRSPTSSSSARRTSAGSSAARDGTWPRSARRRSTRRATDACSKRSSARPRPATSSRSNACSPPTSSAAPTARSPSSSGS